MIKKYFYHKTHPRTNLRGDEEEGLGGVEGQGLHLPVRLLEGALRPALGHLCFCGVVGGGYWVLNDIGVAEGGREREIQTHA